MDDEARETIERFHEALNRRDLDALSDLITDDIVFEATSPDPQDVNTADVAIRPGVEPPDDDPVTRAEHLLHLKMRGWRAGEEGPARVEHRLPPNVAGPVRCRAGGLKHDVVGDQVIQGVEVPAVECLVEPLDGLACLVIHRDDLPLCTAPNATSEPS